MAAPSHLKKSLGRNLKDNYLKHWTPDDGRASGMGADMEDMLTDEHVKSVQNLGLDPDKVEVYYNASPAILYEQALRYEKGTSITATGALVVRSGAKTGRSPQDKRVVDEPSSTRDVWWGKVNIKLEESSFLVNRERAIDYLNTNDRIYVTDGFAGWDPEYRVPVRVITSRAYHALYMQNMLVAPTDKELDEFEVDAFPKPFVIYNAGNFPANRYTEGMTSSTSVAINFERGEMVILGTQYAGEMKKGVLTVMMYLMPLRPSRNLSPAERALPLHSSCNVGKDGDVSLFFGLSGTGKTTLSADPERYLIGDDEHVWTSTGVFNIEGGCYAKCIDLSREKEPEIFDAIRFGAVQENVVFDPWTREVDYANVSITENTRCAYPLKFIPNAYIPATIKSHPSNIILLTCDAFGVLPPVSKLTPEQAMYHFIAGYTAKVAGTEMGVTEPTATFSACFGGPFLVWHPYHYAEMLSAKMVSHTCPAWLLNTGWVGGGYGVGHRCPLKYTRQIVDAIHDGTLLELPDTSLDTMTCFGLSHPKVQVKDVPSAILNPQEAWEASGKGAEYKQKVRHLAGLFEKNFEQYASQCSDAVIRAGPRTAFEPEARQ
jgi:phosphoenolpyruvate carboxykinase (ATP)